jgi:hypothetical protein
MTGYLSCPLDTTLTGECAGCGQPFGYLASVLANGTTPRWCTPRCRNRMKRARWLAKHAHPCVVCGGDADPSSHSHGVALCGSCKSVRWLSCQSKRRHPVQADAEAATWPGAPFCYPCPICRGWHTTASDGMPPDWHVATSAIGEAVARLEAAQGWVWLHPAAPDSRREIA